MAQRTPLPRTPSDRNDLFSRKSDNPFFNDDDDGNDFSSPRAAQPRRNGAMSSNSSAQQFDADGVNDEDQARQRDEDFVTQIQASKNRQLESSRRALQSMYESEQIGVATAEELGRQGDKLNNIETKLDSMNSTLNQTQRHLNNIKSIFGGFTNWLSKPRDQIPVKPGQPNQPGAATPQTAANGRASTSVGGAAPKGKSEYSGFFAEEANATNDPYERETNQNLTDMSSGIGRLKNLAEGLGSELDRQNAQIERTVKKTDVINPRLVDQNRQMRQILGQK